MIKQRKPCPRCGRSVAVNATARAIGSRAVARHIDPETDDWCTGRPKTVPELITDLLASVSTERTILATVVDRYIEFGETLVGTSRDYAEQQAKSTEIIRKITVILEASHAK